MKYTVTIEIALPRERVIDLLTEPAHRPSWLRGLVGHETVRGDDGHVGTESRVVFRSGKQTMECIETITRRDPVDLRDVPPEQVVHYEREIVTTGMWNAAREHLATDGPHRTRWVSENEFRFSGPMRVLAPLLRGSFVKQSRVHLEDFKAFAENGVDVRHTAG